MISDTHGLLRPEATQLLEGCDLIVHAGDIGKPEVISSLESIAPLQIIRGNVDKGGWAADLPDTVLFDVAGTSVYVLHDVTDIDLDPDAADIGCVISGHSHQPLVRHHRGVLFLNPGSAGPRRFKLPTSVATLHLNGESLRAQIHYLTP